MDNANKLTFGQQFGQTAANMGLGLLGGGIGSIVGGIINNEFNKQAEERAWEKQLALYDKMKRDNSPLERRRQLEEAGLSPALLYSGGASGVGGAASGTTAQMQAVDTGLDSGSMGLMMAGKQMQLIDAQINKTNVEADKIAGADTDLTNANIGNVIQDTNNKAIQARLTGLQADYQEIKNFYEAELTEANIQEVRSKIDYINSDNQRLIYSNEITNASKGELITANMLNNAMMLSNIAKNSAQINEIRATIEVLKTTKDLNIAKTEGEKLLNLINGVEADVTVNSGMTKESGILGSLVNGLRVGISGIKNIVKDWSK